MIDNIIDNEIVNHESKEILIEKLCTTMIDDLISYINNDNYTRVAQFYYMLKQIEDNERKVHLENDQKEIFQKLKPMIGNKLIIINNETNIRFKTY